MSKNRWNEADLAHGYDLAAHLIHPWYEVLQAQLLHGVATLHEPQPHVIDLGAGSGRWAVRFLNEFPGGRITLVDRSAPFLELARARLSHDRATLVCSALQDDWTLAVPRPAHAIVSMSAIHHLESHEKRRLYQRCFDSLTPGGLLLNGDEIRPSTQAEYLSVMQAWAGHMRSLINAQKVTPAMAQGLEKWCERNIERFEEPRQSGDDCHDTAETQLAMLREIGFVEVDLVWSEGLWGCLYGRKPASS